ncbi:MAG: hypothetical protein EOO62_25845, partial [Hymenobacter sp.]
MGQPAAALGDMAAHGGLIVTGSFNVLIGGRPAARVGDTIACPFHGAGVVSKGSFTVLINGMPAARLGDITGCMVVGLAPVSIPQPTLGPPAAPQPMAPIEEAHSWAPRFDHRMHDELDKAPGGVSAFHSESRLTDSNGDGEQDTAEGSFEVLRMRNAGQVNVGQSEVGGTNSVDILYANTRASRIRDTGHGGSLSGTAEAGVAKWGVGGTIGDADSKGLNPVLGVAGEANLAHFKADGDLLVGDDGNRVGMIVKGELGGEMVKGEVAVTHTLPIWPGYNIQAVGKASADAAS